MTMFNVYANGIFWGSYEAPTAAEAMQMAADENGTIDVGQDKASTEGMTAIRQTDDFDYDWRNS